MRSVIGKEIVEYANPEDALTNLDGVAQVLSHFAMAGGIDLMSCNGEMFAMLAAVLEDSRATLGDALAYIQS